MTRTYPYSELHAFPDGDRPHSGNPAGVMVLEDWLEDADLLGIAQSNNLSETAYLVDQGEDRWHLRWFTPGLEVDFCGHATLASAVYLFEDGHVTGDRVSFEARVGELKVHRENDHYVMDVPLIGWEEASIRPGVMEALGAGGLVSAHEVEQIHGAPYQMLVYESEAIIAGMEPDFEALARTGVNVVVTARGETADYVARFFCPAAGINEDPVTGSAHATLGPYWMDVLNRAQLIARQIGPRPGALGVRTGAGGRVELMGSALRFLDGQIRL